MQEILSTVLLSFLTLSAGAEQAFERDVIGTSGGDLEIYFVGHASLILKFGGRTVHADPYGKLADYGKMPKADLLLITHEHQDHLDPAAAAQVRTASTVVVLPEAGAQKLGGGTVMKNGDVRPVMGITIEAVPAYNLLHKRENGEPFHPRGRGNGYVLTFGSTRVYLAGDTEIIPEMQALRNIDIAFLPMNLPYTMTPQMVADAARAIRPKILYPYHYGETDTSILAGLLGNEQGMEVRIRNMK